MRVTSQVIASRSRHVRTTKLELCPFKTLHPRPRALGSKVFSEQAWAEIARALKLSGRELQIVRGVFNDRTEFAIAADLGISPHTVHIHFERLHRKLTVGDRVEMVLRVTEEFLALTTAPGSQLPAVCSRRAAGRCPFDQTTFFEPGFVLVRGHSL